MASQLMEAVLHSDIQGIRQALAFGADPNEIDGGMTPLLFAVYRGDLEAVRLLLEQGAEPNLRPNPADWSHTALWHAQDFGLATIEDLLKSHGAKV